MANNEALIDILLAARTVLTDSIVLCENQLALANEKLIELDAKITSLQNEN
jgi:hypothetical protein